MRDIIKALRDTGRELSEYERIQMADATEVVFGLKEQEIKRLHGVLSLAAKDLSLIVAKYTIGKDRTAVRMKKYLNAEKKK